MIQYVQCDTEYYAKYFVVTRDRRLPFLSNTQAFSWDSWAHQFKQIVFTSHCAQKSMGPKDNQDILPKIWIPVIS